MADSETMGVTQMHTAVKVSMAEMEGWEPDRIAAFFRGLAQVIRAANGLPCDEVVNIDHDEATNG